MTKHIVSSWMVLLLLPIMLYSQWSTDPTQNLIVGYGLNPELASDSAGGCYVTYEQNTTYPRHLVLERLNRYGIKPWGSVGKMVRGQLPEQWFAKIIEDGQRGVIISYIDEEDTGTPGVPIVRNRLRVQRIDSTGRTLWDSLGVRVSVAETNQGDQAIVSDGLGGCIIAWLDTLSTLRIQRVDSSGARVWGDSGIVAFTNVQSACSLARLDDENFVLACGSTLERFDLGGTFLWNGQSINVGIGTRSILAYTHGSLIVYDGAGTSSNVIYAAQKIDSAGNLSWAGPYITIAESTVFSIFGYPLTRTTEDMIMFVWEKTTDTVTQIFAQEVSSDGSLQWRQDGIGLSQYSSTDNLIIDAVASNDGGMIVSWRDLRGGLYSQKLNHSGQQMWNLNDVALSVPPLTYIHSTVDGSGGMILVGFCQPDFSIRIQQVSRNGKLGEIITTIIRRDESVPSEFILYQNYPNPFNSSTIIRYDVSRRSWVRIQLFDVLGQLLQTLVDQFSEPGSYQVIFDGQSLPSGIYFYRMQTGRGVFVNKLTILK
ncbi:MAG: T9SS type A sorting domain-containing protein [Ignavibacteriae bacterium]|nr:T9SS type A sorting domain-containing protein [Ignavibacteriota bacterium]